MTGDAGTVLWQMLPACRLGRFKFRRETPLDLCIARCYCAAERLIASVEGDLSGATPHDPLRATWLRQRGSRVLRVVRVEVPEPPDRAAGKILAAERERVT